MVAVGATAVRRFAVGSSRGGACSMAHHRRMASLFSTGGWRVTAAMAAGGAGLLGGTAAVAITTPAQMEGCAGCDNPAVLAGVVIVGAAAYAVQTRSATVGVDPDYRYVVDCGSGGTRIEKFGADALGGIFREVKRAPAQALPLHKVLAEGEAQQKRWLAALAQAVADDTTPIFIGATAGVRDSVASGTVSEAALKRFAELVSAQFGTRARFALVDGVLEAASELAAVRYCVSKQAWWDGPTGSIAVMSSGGMSAQLTFPSDSGLVASSIPHNQKEANDRIRDPKVGVERGLSDFETSIQSLFAMDPALEKAKAASAAGAIFVGIEMLAQVADAAGIGGQLMTVADAKTAIRQLVADFKANAAAASAEEVFFCGKFDLPSQPGSGAGESRSLKPAWTLGWYIDSRLAIGL